MPSKATIQRIRSLSLKKFRDELGLFVAEGDKLVQELLESTLKVEQLFVTNQSRLAAYNFSAKELVSDEDMKRLSLLKTPSTALAVLRIPQADTPVKLEQGLSLALDGIQDPGNLGTIIRLADWFGIQHIICSPDTADCYNPKVVQATMGAIARVDIRYQALPELLKQLPSTLPVYGTFLTGANIYETSLSLNALVVVGNEGQGISPEVEQLIQNRLHIPSFANSEQGSESLNVAIATAIVCSEFRRGAHAR